MLSYNDNIIWTNPFQRFMYLNKRLLLKMIMLFKGNTHRRLLFLVTLLSGISFLFHSCGKPGCSNSLTVDQSSMIISFIDKQTGRYLYSENSPLYTIDSLKVFDESGKQFQLLYALSTIPGGSGRYYTVAIGPIYNSQTDQNSFYRELCRNFIVKYKYNETDTIKTCFKSKNNDCGSVFETLKLFYKDSLINNISDNNYTILNLYKK